MYIAFCYIVYIYMMYNEKFKSKNQENTLNDYIIYLIL